MLDLLIISFADKTPAYEDVNAGPLGFIVFVVLILAVALIGWSLTRQLRKAQAAKDAGIFGDQPAATEQDADPAAPSSPAPPPER